MAGWIRLGVAVESIEVGERGDEHGQAQWRRAVGEVSRRELRGDVGRDSGRRKGSNGGDRVAVICGTKWSE